MRHSYYSQKPYTFDMVKAVYDKTPPVREHDHGTKFDVRPIGPRWRKYERIRKFKDGSYALMSGDSICDDYGYKYSQSERPPERLTKKYAPILWRRIKGKDVVTITYCKRTQANGFMNFLNDFLPWGMRFMVTNGKYYLIVNTGGGHQTKYALHLSGQENSRGGPNQAKRITYKDVSLSFVAHGKDERGYPTYSEYRIPRAGRMQRATVVNKDAKAAHKEHIAEFTYWLDAMMPMLPHLDNYQAAYDLRSEISTYLSSRPEFKWDKRTWLHLSNPPVRLAREVLCDPHHPMRVPFGILAKQAMCTDGWRNLIVPERSLYLSRRNSWINRTFGFLMEVEREI